MRTLGGPILALLLQGDGGGVSEGSATSILELLSRSTPLAKAVLVTLGVFSVLSWSIFLYKTWAFRRAPSR